jgi:mono/diheme cytochrome c family protein
MAGDGGFTVDKVSDAGVLKSARWVKIRELSPGNQVAAGREIFRVECASCHTPDSYRGIHQLLVQREWDQDTIKSMIGGLYLMHNGVMPPFAGTDAELDALAAYLATLQTAHPVVGGAVDGKTVYEHDCAMCHALRANDHLFSNMPRDPKTAVDALKDLPGMFPVMPDLKLTEGERTGLVQWVNTVRPAAAQPALPQPAAAAPSKGGN